jgi:hypothetical protein
LSPGTLLDLSFQFSKIRLAERWNPNLLPNPTLSCTTKLEVSTLTKTKKPELFIRSESEENVRIIQNDPILTEKGGEMSETPRQLSIINL